MSELEQQISTWRYQMLEARISSDDVAELESHLRDEVASLVKSGVLEEKAFRVAATALGDGKALRKEFSRSRRHWLWGFQNNPLPLKIIAASFILTGLDPLLTAARFSIESLFHGQNFALGSTFLFVVIFWGFQVALGLGLLRRSNAWRWVTIAWSSFILLLIVSTSTWAAFHRTLIQNGPNPKTDFLLGVEVPFMFKFSLYLLHLAIMAASIFILTRPAMRTLFRRDSANLRTAS
jgi:hypothetical protein